MENNIVIDIIIEFINASKKEKNQITFVENGINYAINNTKYLLGQIIRQYSIPWSHYFVSKKAKELWEAITDENMSNYWYRYRVYCNKENNVIIKKYNGAKRKPWYSDGIKVGQWFYYREVFHDEHIVTINDIINELLSLENVNKENVINILDKIYICRMLKSEDRDLPEKIHRSLDYREVINGPYKQAGVEVIKDYFHD